MLRIKEIRKSKKITAKELADYVKVAESTMSLYENGKREPDFDTLLKIAHYLQTSIDYLLGNTESANTKKQGIKIPVLGYVAAGIPISAIEDIIDYEEIPEQMLRDGSEYFALQIKGQSMEPRIYNGDVVIVRKQPDVDSGQIAIVCVNGDEATCKKIVKQAGDILLQPLNPAYQTVFYSAEQIENIPITILGRVVELRGKNF